MCAVQSKVPTYGEDPWTERLMIGEPLWCIYCNNVSIHTDKEWVKVYVCDDCNEKNKDIFKNKREK